MLLYRATPAHISQSQGSIDLQGGIHPDFTGETYLRWATFSHCHGASSAGRPCLLEADDRRAG